MDSRRPPVDKPAMLPTGSNVGYSPVALALNALFDVAVPARARALHKTRHTL